MNAHGRPSNIVAHRANRNKPAGGARTLIVMAISGAPTAP